MRKLFAAIAFASLAGLGALPASVKAAPPVIRIPTDDSADMQAAIAKARETLPAFWQSYANPGEGESNFAVKLAVADGELLEFFWLVDLERDGDVISGKIGNEPAGVTTVKLGERVSFTEDQITDWTFMRGGKMVGNETMRPLLKRMPGSDAQRFKSLYEMP
jgi:uncharacterized protein YegJ (DUF2314 family)